MTVEGIKTARVGLRRVCDNEVDVKVDETYGKVVGKEECKEVKKN